MNARVIFTAAERANDYFCLLNIVGCSSVGRVLASGAMRLFRPNNTRLVLKVLYYYKIVCRLFC